MVRLARLGGRQGQAVYLARPAFRGMKLPLLWLLRRLPPQGLITPFFEDAPLIRALREARIAVELPQSGFAALRTVVFWGDSPKEKG